MNDRRNLVKEGDKTGIRYSTRKMEELMIRTSGKYAVVKRDAKKETSDGGIIMSYAKADDVLRGSVVSHPDSTLDGSRVAYMSSAKEVDGHDIVNVDSILCVIDAA